jgi:hypothetical protein
MLPGVPCCTNVPERAGTGQFAVRHWRLNI